MRATGTAQKDGASTNKSLLALGAVVNKLGETSKKVRVGVTVVVVTTTLCVVGDICMIHNKAPYLALNSDFKFAFPCVMCNFSSMLCTL